MEVQRDPVGAAARARAAMQTGRPQVPPFYFNVAALIHSNVISSKLASRRKLFKFHMHHCLARWSYVYGLYVGGADITTFARICVSDIAILSIDL